MRLTTLDLTAALALAARLTEATGRVHCVSPGPRDSYVVRDMTGEGSDD